MTLTAVTRVQSHVQPWGNGLGLRITQESVRIIIEAVPEKTSRPAILANVDPKRHGDEAMAFAPLGKAVKS